MVSLRKKNIFLPLAACSVYLFMYCPLIVLVAFSFNEGAPHYSWQGWALYWYHELARQGLLWSALKNSLIVACGTVFLSLTIGSLFVFFGNKSKKKIMPFLFYANLGLPEIMIAVGILSFFSFWGVPFGLISLMMFHTVLGLGYVVPLIDVRYQDLDDRYVEASLDLGATPGQTFFKIVLPLLFPALFSAGLLVFMVSFDDFIISYFCAGASAQTLPLYIFSMLRAGASPVIAALSTILMSVSSVFVLFYLYFYTKKERNY